MKDPSLWHWLWWLITPALLGATVWLVHIDAPFRIEFWVSRRAFDQVVRQRTITGSLIPGPRRVGLFNVDSTEVTPKYITLFWTSRGGRAFFRYDVSGTGLPGEIDLGTGWSAGSIPGS
jgi:hypothetical protein